MDSPDTKSLSRREREMLRRRAEILDAAEEVFSEKGYQNASMEDIARRAEFSVGSLYNFFKNKEDLYVEMLHSKVASVEPVLRKALETGETPLDRIRNFFLTRFDFFWANPRFFKVYYHESMGTQFDQRAGFTPEVIKRYEDFMARLEGEFRAAIREGQLEDRSTDLMVLVLEGTMHQAVVRLLRYPVTERDKEKEKELFDLIVGGFLKRG